MRDLYFVIIGAAAMVIIIALTVIVMKARERAELHRLGLAHGDFTDDVLNDQYIREREFD